MAEHSHQTHTSDVTSSREDRQASLSEMELQEDNAGPVVVKEESSRCELSFTEPLRVAPVDPKTEYDVSEAMVKNSACLEILMILLNSFTF